MLAMAVILITSTAKAQTTPNSVGYQVFYALKSSTSYNEFAKYFVTANDCRTLALQATNSAAHNELNDLADALEQGEVIENRVYRVYSIVKGAKQQLNIDWSKIEYVDWFYKTKGKMGINGCVGTLIFKYKGKHFIVSPVVYNVNNIYKLAHWGNSFEKILMTVLSENLNTTYQNGQYCLSDGAQSECMNIAQELNEMNF